MSQHKKDVSNRGNRFKALWQVPVLLAIATLTALCVNALRSDRLPLLGDWSAAARLTTETGESLQISLEAAHRQFLDGSVVFVDARPESQYAAGHIRGALSLPWHLGEDLLPLVMDRLAPDASVVTYCDGETCESSHELALFLRDLGFENIRILVNGWTVWQQSGLPIATGTFPAVPFENARHRSQP